MKSFRLWALCIGYPCSLSTSQSNSRPSCHSGKTAATSEVSDHLADTLFSYCSRANSFVAVHSEIFEDSGARLCSNTFCTLVGIFGSVRTVSEGFKEAEKTMAAIFVVMGPCFHSCSLDRRVDKRCFAES